MNSCHLYLDNVIFSGQKSGGISVVWYELIKRLLKDNYPVDFIDNNAISNPYRQKLDLNGCTTIKDWLYPLSSLLPVHIKHDVPFIFHSSYYRYCFNPKAVNITTVHDFIYEYYRRGPAKWKHCWQKYPAIRRSQYIVCISENTKKDLIKFLPEIEEDRIRVIYNGVSEEYCVIPKQKYIHGLSYAPFSYVVYVGNRMGYKNFDLIKKCIAQSDYRLVIVGSKPSEQEENEIRKYIPENKYVCTGFVTNEQLNVIYNHAAALIYPSSYEGFGIPIVEAQRAGCPVIAYASSSIPEVIGETSLLMKELSQKELLSKLNLLANRRLVESIRQAGLENSKRFSWDKMYQEYLQLYQEVFSKFSK